MKKPVFKLSDINFSFGSKQIFLNLNLELPPGSICAILGPNGTGKTTLLHLLLGWLSPDSGTILLSGENLGSFSPRRRGKTLSLLPQKENLSFEYSVTEYILLGRAPYLSPLQQPTKKDWEVAQEALKTVGAANLAHRKNSESQRGETQVCLMARSLTQEPEILLLDEPTNHLDLGRKREMLNLMQSYRQQGKTVIFTTHDPELAARIADYLVLIGSENRVLSGPFEELFTEEALSSLYDIPIKIIPTGDGKVTIVY